MVSWFQFQICFNIKIPQEWFESLLSHLPRKFSKFYLFGYDVILVIVTPLRKQQISGHFLHFSLKANVNDSSCQCCYLYQCFRLKDCCILSVHQEKCHQYWPAERSARYQYFVVDPMAEYNMPQYILREFKVTDARVRAQTLLLFVFYIACSAWEYLSSGVLIPSQHLFW